MKLLEVMSKNKILRELYIEVDIDNVINYVSPNSLNIIGYEPNQMIGRKFEEFINEKVDFNKLENNMCITFKKLNGDLIYMDISHRINIEKNKKTIDISLIDVTKYMLQEEKLKRVLQIFEKSNDIIYSLDIKPEPNYVYISPAIEKELGYSIEDSKENPFLPFEVVHPDYYNIQVSKLKGEKSSFKNVVTRFRHRKNAEYIWYEDYCMPIYNESGELVRIDGICRNIQERKELEEKLKYLSYHDALTGLFNRTYFEERIKELNEKRDTRVGIIICDLDNLKYVNDKFGHSAGDQLIKAIGKIISDRFNEKHAATRFGGDEFAIIIEDIEYEDMKREVMEFKREIIRYNEINPKLPIKVSLGFSFAEKSKGLIYEIFKVADKNMFKEKAKGRNFNCNEMMT